MFYMGKQEYYLINKEEYEHSQASKLLKEDEKILEVFTNDTADLVFTTSRIISVYSPAENHMDLTYIDYDKILYVSLLQWDRDKVVKVTLTISQGLYLPLYVEGFAQAKKIAEIISAK